MEVSHVSNVGRSAKASIAEELALGIMGVAELKTGLLSDSVTWQNGREGALMGRDSISNAIVTRSDRSVIVDEIVTHGNSAAVSGRIRSETGTRLFCHMIKYTSASAKQVASIVSFEHPVKDPK